MSHSIPKPSDITGDGAHPSLRKAYHLGICAGLANQIPKLGVANVRSRFTSNGWSPVQVWDHKNNQGFALFSDEVTVLVFAGTNSIGDWGKNIRALFPQRHPLGGRVHRGFSMVLAQLAHTEFNLGDNASTPLYIAGHSLGGAVATGFYADLLAANSPWATKARVITYGMPRFGNIQFSQAYNQRTTGRHWWFANSQDPVTKLPTNFMGYRHVGKLHYFTRMNELTTPPPASVGLQNMAPEDRTPDEAARMEWLAEEAALPRVDSEPEFQRLAEAAEAEIERYQERITISEDGRMEIAPMAAELEGDGVWYGARHFMASYIENIHRALAG